MSQLKQVPTGRLTQELKDRLESWYNSRSWIVRKLLQGFYEDVIGIVDELLNRQKLKADTSPNEV